ncbi:MAG: methionyl-tRNA formyltransferase [Elusimicrobia bacterium]|mgnify:CR=1 FL=1|nr:methionyl-tRNA formyltransferase [Elusimicrobiota bacterium]
MKILFFGCDDFAATSLIRLIHPGHKVVGLVTQPDRPQGRGMHILFSATKQVALAHSVPVFQPQTLKDPGVIERLRAFEADLFVVIAYGKILPASVLSLPRLFCLNVHASLLPKFRGAAPVNWAIIHGEKKAGVTLIRMNEGMDTGDMIASREHSIGADTTAQELRGQLAVAGADLLLETLPLLKEGRISFTVQDERRASKAPKMTKDLGHINWAQPAQWAHDLIRGVQPWPGAYTFWHGARLKILDTSLAAMQKGVPGEIIEVHKDGFFVQAGEGALLVRRVHPANSHAMDARAFLAGHRIKVGDVLG